METTFLLFEGLYGSGKSTTSQYVADQLAHNGIQVEWLDEYQLFSRIWPKQKALPTSVRTSGSDWMACCSIFLMRRSCSGT
jgi:thymidylate kinase